MNITLRISHARNNFMFGIILSCLLLVITSSISGQVTRTDRPVSAAENVPNATRGLMVTLERTGCLGTCPKYRLTVWGDGRIVYEGLGFVKTLGRIESTITKTQVRQVISAVIKARYFKIGNSYVTGADGCTSYDDDSPSIYTSVRYKKKQKAVPHSAGCSGGQTTIFASELKSIAEFEDRIDDIVDVKQWIGTDDERKKFAPSIFLPRSFLN